MPAGGHTTLIQRVLDRRAETPSNADEGTTATVAVMVRVQPPPKALLVFEDAGLRTHTERPVGPELLKAECVEGEFEALRRFEKEFRPVVLTDNPEIIRTLRQHRGTQAPYILYVSESTDVMEREGRRETAYISVSIDFRVAELSKGIRSPALRSFTLRIDSS